MKKEYITPVSKIKRIDSEAPLCLSNFQEVGDHNIRSKEDWFSEDEEDENEGATPVYTYNAWGE